MGDVVACGASLFAVASPTGQNPLALAAAWAVPGSPIDPEGETAMRYEAQYAIFRELYPITRHLMHRLADLDRAGEATHDVSTTDQ